MTFSNPLDLSLPPEEMIGVVGSSTSTHTVHVDLVGSARERSINGRMVVIAPVDHLGNREFALGTVTDVEQTNIYHTNPALRGVIANRGSIPGLTERADIKTATVAVQSAFRTDGNRLTPVGGAMSFAASTGERVYLATADIVGTLATQATADVFYLGHLYRQPGVPLPLSVPDFAGSRGGSNASFFGPSGSGKTYVATFALASQLRHLNMGVLVVDPQGQFTTTARVATELGVDVRKIAEDQGRAVHQMSVARDIRLPEKPDLMTTMLADGKRNFFGSSSLLGVTGGEKASDVQDLINMWLGNQRGWSDWDLGALLEGIVEFVRDQAASGAIYAGIDRGNGDDLDLPENDDKPANRLYHNLNAVLEPDRYPNRDGAGRRQRIETALRDVFPLFTSTRGGDTPGERVPVRTMVEDLCDSELGGKPRPLYLLTLAGGNGRSALDSPRTQSTILRVLLADLEDAAQHRYLHRPKHPANVLVFMDEAARFASPRSSTEGGKDIAEDLARYMREIRKYSVGFWLILQEPAALHESIWKQLRNGFQVFAGGLVGSDLEKVREQVGSPSTMRLYSQLAQPSTTNPVYPYMLCGNVSPLSATSAPLFMQAFTDPEDWVRTNKSAGWLSGTFHAEDTWRG